MHLACGINILEVRIICNQFILSSNLPDHLVKEKRSRRIISRPFENIDYTELDLII